MDPRVSLRIVPKAGVPQLPPPSRCPIQQHPALCSSPLTHFSGCALHSLRVLSISPCSVAGGVGGKAPHAGTVPQTD